MVPISSIEGHNPVCCDTQSSVNGPKNSRQQSLFERVVRAAEEGRRSIKDRAFRLIDRADVYLEKKMPTLPYQKAIDLLASSIQQRFAFLSAFNAWACSDGRGTWYEKLAICLYKLPHRAALNIVRLIYSIINEALYFSVHPTKSILRLARLCIRLLDLLTTPETWALLGAGMVGSSFGYSLVTATPLPLIGTAVGAALCIGGISLGALKQALLAENNQRWHQVGEFFSLQVRKIPEAILTGFLMGIIAGTIQQAVSKPLHRTQKFSSDSAKELIDKFLKDNNLPPPSHITFDPGNTIQLHWNSPDPNWVINGRPLSSYTTGYESGHVTLEHFYLSLRPSGPTYMLRWKYTYDAWWDFERGCHVWN